MKSLENVQQIGTAGDIAHIVEEGRAFQEVQIVSYFISTDTSLLQGEELMMFLIAARQSHAPAAAKHQFALRVMKAIKQASQTHHRDCLKTVSPPPTHTRTHTHTHTHAHTHTHTHRHTQTHAHTRTHTLTETHSHIHTRAQTHTYTNASTRTQSHAPTGTHSHNADHAA